MGEMGGWAKKPDLGEMDLSRSASANSHVTNLAERLRDLMRHLAQVRVELRHDILGRLWIRRKLTHHLLEALEFPRLALLGGLLIRAPADRRLRLRTLARRRLQHGLVPVVGYSGELEF